MEKGRGLREGGRRKEKRGERNAVTSVMNIF